MTFKLYGASLIAKTVLSLQFYKFFIFQFTEVVVLSLDFSVEAL